MKSFKHNFFVTGLIFIIFLLLKPSGIFAQKVTKLFESGQTEKAEQYCLKQKAEKQKACYTELADAYFGVENYEKAAELYAKSGNPDEGYKKIAKVFFDNEDFENAVQYYSKTSNPDEGYLLIAGVFFNKQDFENAAVYYAKTKDPESNYIKIANAYFDKNDYENAAMFYEKGNNSRKGYLQVADKLINSGNYDEAIKLYGKGDGFNELIDLGNNLFKQGKYLEAKKSYNEALNGESEFFLFQNMWGMTQEQTLKILEALDYTKYDDNTLNSEGDSIVYKSGFITTEIFRYNNGKLNEIKYTESQLCFKSYQKQSAKKKVEHVYEAGKKYPEILGDISNSVDESKKFGNSSELTFGTLNYEWMPDKDRINYPGLYFKIEIRLTVIGSNVFYSYEKLYKQK